MFFIKQGEYAESYRVKSEEGKLCFLKLINRGKLHKSQFTEDGEILEIEIVKVLNNPGLCKFVDDGETVMNGQRYAYFITEFISGETVAQKVTREQRCSVYDAKNIAIHTLEALQYLHTLPNPVIHNEVTIQNIMLDMSKEDNAIKLIDFGYANYLNEQTRGYKLDGLNPFYLAPERFNGVSCVQSDLYAVGAMIYHLLFGITPWYIDLSRYEDSIQIDAILEERRKPLKMINTELFEMDEQLINTMAKAMAFDVDHRFQNAGDFIKALKGELKVEPQETVKGDSTERSSTPKRNIPRGNGFKDVAGMAALKEEVTKSVLNILRNTERAKKYKISIPNGMLLYGPPGCGKSFFAEKFAEEAGYNYVFVKSSDLASIYIHGSQEKIGNLFDEARKNAPTILNFDEFEALVPNRSKINNASESGEVNEFLSQLNNCGKDGVFVIASSNRPDLIDPAILRKGRIDKIIYLPIPDKEARAGIFQIHMADRPYELGIDYDRLADMTEFYVASDIAYVVNEAALAASEQDCNITQEIIEDVIKRTTPSASQKVLDEFEDIKHKLVGSTSDKPRNRVGFKTE